MTMIERVARAICKSRTCEGVSCCQWPANAGRLECPVTKGGYDDAARAAIAAMREPTEDMEINSRGWFDLDVWQAMIDAALSQ
jgi:hypothetical protein